MKITKRQLKQIIKEEITKVLSENAFSPGQRPLDVLKQMISEEHRGQTLASPENVQDYLEWIQGGVDDFRFVEGGIKELQNKLKQSLEVIQQFQQAAAQAMEGGADQISLPEALGLSVDDERFGFMNAPLGDPYQPISLKNWVNELSDRGLFYDVISEIDGWYHRYVDRGD
jgi:hypothetical protein